MKITHTLQKFFLFSCILILSKSSAFSQDASQSAAKQMEFACLPCGNECDTVIYKTAGKCPHCQMQLVDKATVTFRSILPSEVCDYLKEHPNVILLDVRTQEEYEGKTNPDFGTMKNAINIPIQELENQLSRINDLKDKEIIVYCSRSHRSPQASYLLTQNGFTKVINMSGGMSAMNDKSCKK